MLLAFDTATASVSVALVDDGEVRSAYTAHEALRHGELLAPAIDRVLTQGGALTTDVTAIAVGAGPGPFTGLRVGLVTARTMAWALEIPVYGVCTLDILALEASDAGYGEFLVATDARRKEVYAAHYRDGARVAGPQVVKPAEVATGLPVVGAGGRLYPDCFPGFTGLEQPSAEVLAYAVALERCELLDPEPLYLRRPDVMAPRPAKPVS